MTIVAIRDGVMAVDSMAVRGSVIVCEIKKWSEVPDAMGGGYVAMAGDMFPLSEAMDRFLAGRDPAVPTGDGSLTHMRSDGSVWRCEANKWVEQAGDFHACGCGFEIALGAMHAGADAKAAAEAACALSVDCGGKIHTLRVKA